MVLALSVQLPAQVISEISALATASLAIVTVATAIATFWNRAKIWHLIKPWVADRVAMKRNYDELAARFAELEEDVASVQRLNERLEAGLKAQETTIKYLRAEVTSLQVVKARFDSLVTWLAKVFEYIALLQSLVPPNLLTKAVRQMPELPENLRDHIEIPEVHMHGSP